MAELQLGQNQKKHLHHIITELIANCLMRVSVRPNGCIKLGDSGIEDELLQVKGVREEDEEDQRQQDKVACVTSASSYTGLAIVKQLLARQYSVVALVDYQEDVERLGREIAAFHPPAATERSGYNNSGTVEIKWVRLADETDAVKRLYDAFDGCGVVFHTSSFIDPSGHSGYTKRMVEVEVKATKNIMEACASVPSVSKCVLTSSLLACIWRAKPDPITPLTVDHNSWSEEQICQDKKLWYALGKLKAEKEAWRIAKENKAAAGLRLATICPALITGPDYACLNPTPTIAYLKGYQEMYSNGVLATVHVTRLAEAHVEVYEAMKKENRVAGPGGCFQIQRYLCFDRVVGSIEEIASETGINLNLNLDAHGSALVPTTTRARGNLYHLSKAKLTRLVSSTGRSRCCSCRLQQ